MKTIYLSGINSSNCVNPSQVNVRPWGNWELCFSTSCPVKLMWILRHLMQNGINSCQEKLHRYTLLGGVRQFGILGYGSFFLGYCNITSLKWRYWDMQVEFGILGYGLMISLNPKIGILALWNWDIWNTGTPPPYTLLLFSLSKSAVVHL